MNTVSADLAEELVAAGTASWLDPRRCRELDILLSHRFPWAGPHLAWEQIDGAACLEYSSFNHGQLAGFVSRLAAVQNETTCILFGGGLGLRVSSSWFLRNLDIAACNSQQFFAFSSAEMAEAETSVAEFEPGCTVWGRLPKKLLHATALRNAAREQ
jgi:hypothetical protein